MSSNAKPPKSPHRHPRRRCFGPESSWGDGTPVTHDRPAIYAPYALYVPPMLSADAAVNASFSYEASRRTAQSIRLSIIGPQDSLFGHFSEGVPTQFSICRNSYPGMPF